MRARWFTAGTPEKRNARSVAGISYGLRRKPTLAFSLADAGTIRCRRIRGKRSLEHISDSDGRRPAAPGAYSHQRYVARDGGWPANACVVRNGSRRYSDMSTTGNCRMAAVSPPASAAFSLPRTMIWPTAALFCRVPGVMGEG